MHKKYVVFVNYGIEGWKIHSEFDDFYEAHRSYEEAMGFGSEVVIFSPVEWQAVLKFETPLVGK